MKVSGNVLETLEDLGLLNLNNLETDQYQSISDCTFTYNKYLDEINMDCPDRNIKFFSGDDFFYCFTKTECSLGIKIFKDN